MGGRWAYPVRRARWNSGSSSSSCVKENQGERIEEAWRSVFHYFYVLTFAIDSLSYPEYKSSLSSSGAK